VDLANMRSLGVRSVDVTRARKHEATVNVDQLPDDVPVPDVRFRLRCSKCGAPIVRFFAAKATLRRQNAIRHYVPTAHPSVRKLAQLASEA
jgi:hypothetical protein